jgi:hypothetical protein
MTKISSILTKINSSFDSDQQEPTFLYRIFYYLLGKGFICIFE